MAIKSDREEYLNTPLNLQIKGIEPIYMPLVTEIFQCGMDQDSLFPAIFDYQERDEATQENKLMVSFALFKSKKTGIVTCRKIMGRERDQLLLQIKDGVGPVKRKRKSTSSPL